MTFDRDGNAHATPLYKIVREAALDLRVRLPVLDTAADLFDGEENNRQQFRRFLGTLNRLAIKIRGAVLLNAHPSREGLKIGNLDGASTAWKNSALSRWTLGRPSATTDGDTDPDARI